MKEVAHVLLIIGPCATGKTTLARKLSTVLNRPLLAKDSFKELIFDILGTGDVEWSHKLGACSFEIIWSISKELCRTAVNHIIEYPTNGPTFLDENLKALRHSYSARISVIELTASISMIQERFQQRIAAGTRHAGHPETQLPPTSQVIPFGHVLSADRYMLVNTDDFSKIDEASILRWSIELKY